jgi:hypothetical protein
MLTTSLKSFLNPKYFLAGVPSAGKPLSERNNPGNHSGELCHMHIANKKLTVFCDGLILVI